MKEYKVVMPKLGLKNRITKYEDFLNQYAREGWVVKHIVIPCEKLQLLFKNILFRNQWATQIVVCVPPILKVIKSAHFVKGHVTLCACNQIGRPIHF